MSLKELTWDNHKKAERKKFAAILMSGNISPTLYIKYLYNQLHNYLALEDALEALEFPSELADVYRADKINEDIKELLNDFDIVFDSDILTPSTIAYADHIDDLRSKGDLQSLIAHMYVRHFGDMYGGAMIAKRIPGSGRMYEFDNKEELKISLRELLNDDMADEANKCFEFAIELFHELGNEPYE